MSYFPFNLIAREFPRTFNMSELFTLLNLNAFVLVNYVNAFNEQNQEYMLFFLPILFINLWALIYILFWIFSNSNLSFFASVFIAVGITVVIGLNFMFSLDFVIEWFLRTIENRFFYYMGIITFLGVAVINWGFNSKQFDIFLSWKLFHYQAFLLFLPTIIYNTKHATLASTVSIGIFIMLECTKWFTKGIGIIDYIKNYESNYLDEREKRDG